MRFGLETIHLAHCLISIHPNIGNYKKSHPIVKENGWCSVELAFFREPYPFRKFYFNYNFEQVSIFDPISRSKHHLIL